jgi:hypothetical protein
LQQTAEARDAYAARKIRRHWRGKWFFSWSRQSPFAGIHLGVAARPESAQFHWIRSGFHVKSNRHGPKLLGSSEVITLSEGELVVGQYQSVMLYELDGPRQRKVSVQVYGE